MRSISLAVLFLFAACEGSSMSRAPIGPMGGTVRSEDGRAVLMVPPGALASETVISVRAVPPPAGEDVLVPTAYEFEPDGLIFAAPAELRVRLDSAPDDGAAILKVLPDGERRAATTRLEGLEAIAELPGFSTYVVAACPHGVAERRCFPPPTLTASYQPNRTIELRWTMLSGSFAFEVQRAITQGAGALDPNALTDADFRTISFVPARSSSVTDSQLSPAAGIYWYRIRLTTQRAFGQWSPLVRETVFGLGTERPITHSGTVPFTAAWAQSTWTPFGPSHQLTNTMLTNLSVVAHPTLGVVVSLVETTGTQSLLRVRRLDGIAWSEVGGGPLNVSMNGRALAPTLVRGTGNDLLVSWTEREGAVTRAYVKRWNGTAWSLLGGGAIGGDSISAHLAVLPAGEPVVATESGETIQVRRFDGTSWVSFGERMGPTSSPVGLPRVAVDSTGKVFVAWVEGNGPQQTVKVAASPDFGVLGNGPAFSVDPADWQLTGFELSMTSDDRPRVVVASRYSANRLATRTWNGTTFDAANDLASSGVRYPVSGTSAFGAPVIAAVEDYRTVITRYFDGATWHQLGVPLARGDQSSGVALVVEGDGRITLALVLRASSGASRLVVERLLP